MDQAEFKQRTKALALRVIRLCQSVVDEHGRNPTAQTIARQLLRAGTSVGANYRAACRARSEAEFVAKMGIVEEEADETGYWMELLIEAGLMKRELAAELMDEADQIVAMTVASIKSTRGSR